MVTIVRVFLILLVALGSSAFGEPEAESPVSFALFFERGTTRSKEWCLSGAFKPGRSVTLLTEAGTCSAETAGTFTFDYPPGLHYFEATFLKGDEKCLSGAMGTAVVGADPSAVSVISPSDDKSPVPGYLKNKALRLLEGKYETWQIGSYGRTDFLKTVEVKARRVLRLNDPGGREPPRSVALLMFGYGTSDGWLHKNGPLAVLIDNRVFWLKGSCTWNHLFFSVNNRIYIAYTASFGGGCGGGQRDLYVYDLSSRIPEEVYSNGNLSD